jgi:hypothetical protein
MQQDPCSASNLRTPRSALDHATSFHVLAAALTLDLHLHELPIHTNCAIRIWSSTGSPTAAMYP